MSFLVQFHPTELGEYEINHDIEIVGCSKKYTVKCHAVCDIPKIDMDPIVMFPAVVDTMTQKLTFEPHLFVLDRNIYNFGNILVHDSPERFVISLLNI